MGKVYILPHLRKGLANNIVDIAGDSKGKKRAEIKVDLNMQASSAKNTTDSYDSSVKVAGKTIEILGPADVKMLSNRAICRKSPTGEVKLNCAYRPFIEFYEEDLPWRYTALSAKHKEFHSWMALIAVKTDEYKLEMRGSVKTAVLNLSAERYAEVFPTLAELKTVAHVQIDTEDDSLENMTEAGEIEKKVNEVLNENPDCGISRILCTSKLEKNTTYTVMVIPTYELGRLSGLGLDLSSAGLDTRAWEDSLEDQQKRTEGMTFPVYAKWNITTASFEANFNTLANRLCHTSDKEYSEMKAYLDVDISKTGLQSAVVDEGTTIDVPASLVIDPELPDLREEDSSYTAKLKETLALNPVFEENESGKIDMESDPWVVPPVYGARHLLTTQEEFENGMTERGDGYGGKYNIVNDVNLLLKNRIAAGMGSQIVKKNQEEFVNRAWKKVEVVNALNQLIREYYQMNQVNEQAKERSPRSEVLKNKDLVNEKNIGLLTDAAIKMLQSSGIYYNKVAPDTLIKESTKMNKKENPIVRNGLSLKRLKELYDQKLWKELIKENIFLNQLKAGDPFESNNATFSGYSALSTLFAVNWENNKAYFKLLGNTDINTEHHLQSVESAWSDYCFYTKNENDNIDMTEYYARVQKMADKKGAFDTVKKTFDKGSLNVLNFNLGTNLGNGFVLPDKDFNNLRLGDKPLLIKCTITQFGIMPWKSKIVLMSQSYFEAHKNQASYSIKTKYGQIENWIDTFRQSDGTFKMSSNTKDKDGKEVSVLHQALGVVSLGGKSETKILTEINHAITVCEPWRTWFFPSKNYSTGDQKDCKDEPYIQVKKTKSKLRISFKGKQHPWFEWTLDKDLTNRFFRCLDGNSFKSVKFGDYVDVMNEILGNIKKFQNLLTQPTDVEMTGLNESEFRVISAEKIVEEALKAEDDNQVNTDELFKAIEVELKNIKKQFNQNVGAGLEEEKLDAKATDIPDPDALAEARIKEICEKYGVTEYNQLKDNLNSKYPVMVYPDFLDPTFFYLRDLSVNYVLPGAGQLLKNTISCFYSNPKFEESFLMGANTEMGRELLWREYPTDQRGSYFRKFWDQTVLPKKDELDKYYDVKPVHLWDKQLGENHMDGKNQMLVFAIKGELMQAFPDTAVYLMGYNKERLFPSMTSWLTEDTYLVGFDGPKKEDLKNYLLVFEQMPMALQFTQKNDGEINGNFKVEKPCIFALPAGR